MPSLIPSETSDLAAPIPAETSIPPSPGLVQKTDALARICEDDIGRLLTKHKMYSRGLHRNILGELFNKKTGIAYTKNYNNFEEKIEKFPTNEKLKIFATIYEKTYFKNLFQEIRQIIRLEPSKEDKISKICENCVTNLRLLLTKNRKKILPNYGEILSYVIEEIFDYESGIITFGS